MSSAYVISGAEGHRRSEPGPREVFGAMVRLAASVGYRFAHYWRELLALAPPEAPPPR